MTHTNLSGQPKFPWLEELESDAVVEAKHQSAADASATADFSVEAPNQEAADEVPIGGAEEVVIGVDQSRKLSPEIELTESESDASDATDSDDAGEVHVDAAIAVEAIAFDVGADEVFAEAVALVDESAFQNQAETSDDRRTDSDQEESLSDDDESVLQRASKSDRGPLFGRLWNGDTRDCASLNVAVEEFCNLLANFTEGNAEQLSRLFRQSAMFAKMPDWDAPISPDLPIHFTIGSHHISNAIARYHEDSQTESLIEVPVRSITFWDDPVPLNNDLKVPPFPVECLTEWMKGFVDAASASLQTPTDLMAMLALSVAGAALARKYEAFVWDGWIEPVNLYTVTALPVGERKSAAVRLATDHIHKLETFLNESRRAEIDANVSKRAVLEKRQANLENQMGKCNEPSKIRDMKQELAKVMEVLRTTPRLRPCQLTCDDETQEHLVKLLADHDGRMSQVAPEGTLFAIVKGRYSERSNFDVYLKAHSGDFIRTGRIGRDGEVVYNPALSIAVAVQPDVIQGLSRDASLEKHGFLARFLYAIPESKVGRRDSYTAPIDRAVMQLFDDNMTKLWKSGPTGAAYNPQQLKFSEAAAKLIRDFMKWIEPQLAPDGALANLAAWPNKLAGTCVRLSAILHCCNQVSKNGGRALEGDPIDETTVTKAIQLGRDYLLPHAKAAMELMGTDPLKENARRVVEVLATWDKQTISRRDIYRNCGRMFKTAKDVDPVLELLEQFGYLRPPMNSLGLSGRGHKSPVYDINPRIVSGEAVAADVNRDAVGK